MEKEKNRILICQYYCEFKILGVDGSNSSQAQLNRFDEFLEIVKKTRDTANVIILGDLNVNLNNDDDNPNSNNAILKDKLLDTLPIEGLTQVIKNDTRHCSGQNLSLIDHIWIKT